MCVRARVCVYIWLSSSHVVTQHLLNSNDFWYMNEYCSTGHTKHTHTISTPIANANNSTKRKRKKQRETATMREPISSGIKKYVYVEYVFCLIPYTEPVRQPKIYTRDFLSIALNGIICCSKIGFQRPKEEKQKRTQTHTQETAQNEMRHTHNHSNHI